MLSGQTEAAVTAGQSEAGQRSKGEPVGGGLLLPFSGGSKPEYFPLVLLGDGRTEGWVFTGASGHVRPLSEAH